MSSPGRESAYAEERYICTQVLFAQLFPGSSKSLTSMCDRLVLDSSERDGRHGALLDADMTADALILMEPNSSMARQVLREHGPRPERRDGSVNKRHSANATQIGPYTTCAASADIARKENRRT